MLKTKARFSHKDQEMSQSVDPLTDSVGQNSNTKAITNPLALSLLIGLNNNNNNKKCISDSDFVKSPKSPLEFKVFATMGKPFFLKSPRSSLTATHLNSCCGPAKVGLSIVDSLGDDRVLSPEVVFGPALRIKDKHLTEPKIEKERSGVVFEICEEDDSSPLRNRSFSVNDCLPKTRVVSRCDFLEIGSDVASSCCLSEDDMEMSEDYTCIITHGPNPKTIHIYSDRVLECHKHEFKDKEKHIGTELDSTFPFDNFLSFCTFCNKKLQLDEDIYMYRGEKAFCSEECRLEEMMMMINEEEDIDDSFITMQELTKKLF